MTSRRRNRAPAAGVGEAITRIAGSSAWFDRGFVTYSNDAKVRPARRDAGNARVARRREREAVAREMAQGALHQRMADVAVAVTGIAGPERRDGRQARRPRLVRLGVARRHGGSPGSRSSAGDRAAVRRAGGARGAEGAGEARRRRAVRGPEMGRYPSQGYVPISDRLTPERSFGSLPNNRSVHRKRRHGVEVPEARARPGVPGEAPGLLRRAQGHPVLLGAGDPVGHLRQVLGVGVRAAASRRRVTSTGPRTGS